MYSAVRCTVYVFLLCTPRIRGVEVWYWCCVREREGRGSADGGIRDQKDLCCRIVATVASVLAFLKEEERELLYCSSVLLNGIAELILNGTCVHRISRFFNNFI